MMKIFKYTAIGLMVVYFFALLAVYFTQRNFMYFPDTSPAPVGFDAEYGVDRILIDVEGVGELSSLYVQAPEGAPIILYFHGNGNSVYSRTRQMRDFKAWGVGFLAVEYPGYGGNIGTPNEADIFATALVNYDMLIAKGYTPQHIVIYGHSLGSSVATYVASQRESTVLILTAPFYSALEMGQAQMPYFPIKLLLKDKFRSDIFMANVEEPLLILHGTADQVVPYAMGRKLLGVHGYEKNFVTIDGGFHDMWNTDMPNYIRLAVEQYTLGK